MAGIKLSLDRRKLVLETATKVLTRSFNNLTTGRKRRFVKHFHDVPSDTNYSGLKLERKLWDIKEQKEFDRVMIRCSISDRELNQPRIFAKAGLTRQIESENDYGLAISYGWNSEFREAGFEKNMIREMNQATDGVKMYYSTPGEKSAVGKLRRPAAMKSYLDS